MPSINAKKAAQEVIKRLNEGEKVIMGEILENLGYAENTVDNPKNVTETKSYQEEMRPIIDQMEEERQAVLHSLKLTRDKAKYRDLMDGLDKLTKNIQLLSGKPTGTEPIIIPIYGGQSTFSGHNSHEKDIPVKEEN